MSTLSIDGSEWQVKPSGGGILAEIDNCNLQNAASWSPEEIEAVRCLIDNHKVLCFRKQKLTVPQYLAFASHFGPPLEYHLVQYAHPESKLVTILSNRVDKDGKPLGLRDAGSYWHIDMPFTPSPPAYTMLLAQEVPPDQTQGVTYFADATGGYADLPTSTQAVARRLCARNNYIFRYLDRAVMEKALSPEQIANPPTCVQPAVTKHPRTGAPSLFVCPGFSEAYGTDPDTLRNPVSLASKEEAKALTSILIEPTLKRVVPHNTWAAGDLVIFDNRALLHKATSDVLPPDLFRTMWRITVGGPPPQAFA